MQSPGRTGVAEAIFEFDDDLNLLRSGVSDSYWIWHRELERAGRVTHTVNECPDGHGLPVRLWTPAAGWADLSAR